MEREPGTEGCLDLGNRLRFHIQKDEFVKISQIKIS